MREPDGLSSLFFALIVLLVLNPYSIASVSLQLSFLSCLGTVSYTHLDVYKRQGRSGPSRAVFCAVFYKSVSIGLPSASSDRILSQFIRQRGWWQGPFHIEPFCVWETVPSLCR